MRWGLLLFLAVLLAGCGGHTTPAVVHTPAPPAPKEQPLPKLLRVDLHAIQREAAKVKHNSLMGTPALQRATGHFLDDVDQSHLSLLEQNRAIDHAATAVAGSCDQCFQMLEADRPIVQVAHPTK